MRGSFVLSLVVASAAALDPTYGVRALAGIDRLVTCSYNASTGIFPGDALWQSGNTLETLANYMVAANSSKWNSLLENTFAKTPVIIDNCFDVRDTTSLCPSMTPSICDTHCSVGSII